MKPQTRRRPSRNLEKSRQEILSAAFGEVYRRGFQGVSVDHIVARTSLTKGAFYHHFPTKRSLGYALVDDVLTPMIMERWITPLQAYDNPLEGIAAQMERLIGGADAASLRTGCPLNNLVQEMTPVDAGFRRRLQRALDRWIGELAQQLERGRNAGYVRHDVDPRQAAHFIVMLHEGTYGLLKGLGDPAAFHLLFASVKAYLRTLEARPAT